MQINFPLPRGTGLLILSLLGGMDAACAQFSITPLQTFGTNGWLAPNGYSGSTYTYLTTGDTERGLAYGNSHLYLVSRQGGDTIRILDAQTGQDLGALNLGTGIVTGGTFDVNMVAVGGDGAIYVSNLAIGPATLRVYRWANDLASTTPTVAYDGVPLAGARVGDTLAATGMGNSTLLAAGFNSTPSVNGNNGYAIIDLLSGTATAVAFSDTPPIAGDFRLGIAFTDPSHVIGTQGGAGNSAQFTSFSGSTGTVLANPALTSTDERPLGFTMVQGFPLLATLDTVTSQVSVYDLTDPANPVLLANANATTGTIPADAHNTGAVTWGEVKDNTAALYAMATDQGIQAFVVTVPAPTPASITSQPQSQAVLELTSATFSVVADGRPAPSYQWFRSGSAIPSATAASYTLASAAAADNGRQFQVVVQNLISNIMFAVTSKVATLTVIVDTNGPTLSQIIPAPESVLSSLDQIEVHFSKGVTGVSAGDLLIDGAPATNVTAYAPNLYVFDFPEPSAGQVQAAWSPAQDITDLTVHSNHFGGGTFNYTLNPAAANRSVLITEFLADNTATIRDEDGHYSDWIELFNNADQPVSLGNWFLTDDATKLTKWQFPAGISLASKSFLIVWASGLDRTNPAAPLHTNFKLSSAAGGFLGLVYSDGTTIVSGFQSYPQQYKNVSYGRDRLDPTLEGYFTTPTPGAPNSTTGTGFGPEVQFSAASGTFLQPFTLALTTADSNSVIHYLLVTNATSALVENIPTSTSPIYTGPLTISNTVQVRARTFPTQPGYWPGPVHNETYFQLGSDAAAINSDLPIVVFHNMGAGTDVPATGQQFIGMQVFDTRNGRSSLVNPPDTAVQGYFHRRGQATFWDPKPNLRVQTEDAYGDNLDVELLGMPADNDWIFYGIDTYDKVLMHNTLAHGLYRDMGHYTSRTRYVEVYIKLGTGAAGPITRADYYGLYVLEEKIKIGKNRVDIDKLQPEDSNAPSVTGGYLLSIDKSNPGNPAYLAGVSMWYLDPDYFTITLPERAAQKKYIDNYFNSFYSALTGPNWTNALTGYAAYIDLDSWIDYHLHQTFVFNVDMLRISAYFYKPRNGKLVQGPLWDFDRAFADSSDDRGFNPRRWRSGSSDGGTDVFNPNCSIFCNPWYGKLFTDPDFWQRWIDRYQDLRKTVYSLTNLYARIDDFGNQVRQATVREYARWTGSGGSDTSPRSGRYSGDGFTYTFPTPGTWQGEIDFTKAWFSNRVDFMDSNFLNPPVFDSSGGAIPSGFTLTITAPTREANSTIYYTLDGTDPRLPGGAVSPSALSNLNTATLTLTNNARVFARNWNGVHRNLTGPNNPPLSSSWSGPTVGTFIVATPPLAITEIMYNPAPPASGTNDNDQFEFIELKNVGSNPLDLIGIRFTNGVDFTFTATNAITNLGPGQYLVLVANRQAFLSRYPEVTNVAGEYSGHLSNSGDRLYLEGALQEPILDFRYETNWFPVTNGRGFSLVIRDENAPFSTWTNSASWRASAALGGSPGRTDNTPLSIPAVVINETLSHSDPAGNDVVELYNPTTSPAPIGGWFLTDHQNEPFRFRIPDNTTIPAGGYLLFNEHQFNNNGTNSFAFSALGDEIYLFSGDGANLTGYRHGFQFGAQMKGVTFGRYVTSEGLEHFVTQEHNTLGQPNARPKVGPVVINEIMFDPPPFGVDADTVDEFVELRNISGQPAPLFDLLHPTNAWRFEGAVQFTFPPQTTMPPWAFLLVVGFDPVHDPASLNWFRGRYGLDTNAFILGPYQGHLANEGERLALYQPGEPEPASSPTPGFVPDVLVEEVHYSHLPPWPAGTDGTGDSLQRLASISFADDPANWQAGAPTPGTVNTGAFTIDTDADGVPDEAELIAGTDPQNSQDFLHFERVSSDGTNCLLEFTGRSGHTYTVETVDQIGSPSTWTLLRDNLVGKDAPVLISDPLTSAGRFYRLKVTRN